MRVTNSSGPANLILPACASAVIAPLRILAKLFQLIITIPFRWIATLPPETEYHNLLQRDLIRPEDFTVALQHTTRNCYSDILPNEPTRVKLDQNFYFNANWVLSKRAIASQGPLPSETQDFWKMIWETDTEAIVMLANPIEQGRDKCSCYWQASRLFHSPKATTRSERVLYTDGPIQIVERTIALSKGGKTKTITQYHLQNWPDFGVVAPSVLAKLIHILTEKYPDPRLLVHCSAGVGRTGTFLAAYEAFRQKTADIFPIAAALRHPDTGRIGLIQTPQQYRLAKETAELLQINPG